MPFANVALVVAAYLLGSIPTGLLIGRIFRGVDLRQHGSGRTGATNTLRTLGPGFAALVLVLDVAKGIVPVVAARYLDGGPAVEAVAAFMAVIGHNWPLYAGFKGGRGVATSLGAMAAMVPFVGVQSIAIGLVLIAVTRFVSLGSMVGAVLAPIVLAPWVIYGQQPLPYLIYAIAGSALLVIQHRDNIVRLQAGNERRLGEPAS